ncbi:hypothetical protein POPTR_006G055550v4 [Populus trichocarpa]|uniref:Uncharacterized protein n=1 Tax=Populus trichocarpa TaxID=3694 RepID=A0ACC0SSG4_POPTR|nr:hypothetical protein BDE02_06G047300 [Populus trichocarpa]KAI9392174.1 hypothetical protein POPTR_006G055550v4 [Populus trichocarpa]
MSEAHLASFLFCCLGIAPKLGNNILLTHKKRFHSSHDSRQHIRFFNNGSLDAASTSCFRKP